MNRRNFLGSIFAGAVMLAAPKLAAFSPPALKALADTFVELPPPIDTKYLRIREQAKEDLAKWYADTLDRVVYAAFIGVMAE